MKYEMTHIKLEHNRKTGQTRVSECSGNKVNYLFAVQLRVLESKCCLNMEKKNKFTGKKHKRL